MTATRRRPVFSHRTAWDLTQNPLSALVSGLRGEGRVLVDLTEGNPTRCGLGADTLVKRLGDLRGARYEPAALGLSEARTAVAAYYRARGAEIDPAQVVLSASTSEAYGWLFKLLTNRDDAVLVPQPSYPLFDYLAALEDVRLLPYPLLREEGFRVDLPAVAAEAANATTRAILVVHPNNPTGTFTRRDDAAALQALAAENGLALVVDEVFSDYAFAALPNDRLPSFADGSRPSALTFVMSGLSKVVAMPQVKLAWTVVLGPDALVKEAMERLEVIADTYLSVSTPVQLALPELLAERSPIQDAVRARVGENLRALDAALREDGTVRRLPLDGGWYATLEVPRTLDEEAWAETLAREASVILQPGYFFDFDREGFLVVSLLPETALFAEAIARVVRRLSR